MHSMTGPIVFGGLIVWSIIRRVRRNIGRQKLRPRRITVSIIIFSVLSLAFIGISLQQPLLLAGIGGGLLAGVLLGFLGLRLTRFETTDEGHFYTPNTPIGIGLSVLFVGRMLYRFWVFRDADSTSDQPQLLQSPLTLLIFGLVAGYYLVYYIGLFVHTHDKKPAVPPAV